MRQAIMLQVTRSRVHNFEYAGNQRKRAGLRYSQTKQAIRHIAIC